MYLVNPSLARWIFSNYLFFLRNLRLWITQKYCSIRPVYPEIDKFVPASMKSLIPEGIHWEAIQLTQNVAKTKPYHLEIGICRDNWSIFHWTPSKSHSLLESRLRYSTHILRISWLCIWMILLYILPVKNNINTIMLMGRMWPWDQDLWCLSYWIWIHKNECCNCFLIRSILQMEGLIWKAL